MKEYKVENWMNVRTASMLARRYRPSPAYTVLLRSDRFYVLDDSVKVRTVVAQMPVLAGDKFFDIEDLAAAEAMKLPILKGEEAADMLLKHEEARTGKKPVYVPEGETLAA